MASEFETTGLAQNLMDLELTASEQRAELLAQQAAAEAA